jgi:ribonuclease R
VMIRVVAANLDKRQLDYEWVLKADAEDAGEVKSQKPKVKSQKAKGAVKKPKKEK